VDTAVPAARLDFLGERITTLQHEVELHARVQKVLDDRRRMRAGELAVDSLASCMPKWTLRGAEYRRKGRRTCLAMSP
jgi:hypothetical protein